jgi:GNAT superfamily N-acetyltransferase
MIIREATPEDIKQMQIVRNAVKENVLSNPSVVTDEACLEYITVRGKGWVSEIDKQIVGFSIADLKDNSIWALFVDPAFEKQGIGRQLHQVMLDWYFSQTQKTVWLETSPNTRAETFYRKSGWIEVGKYREHDIKFEMTYEDWMKAKDIR